MSRPQRRGDLSRPNRSAPLPVPDSYQLCLDGCSLWYADGAQLVSGTSGDGGEVAMAMTMATINVLLGMMSILFALGVALGALAYAVEGIRSRGGLRRWNLVVAAVLGTVAWGMLTGVGQDFARASDARLRSQPAGAASLSVVLVWTLIGVGILVADIRYFRGLARSY